MWEIVSALKGLANVPERAMVERLAQHWKCTPAEVRAQDENDIAIACAWLDAEVEAVRERTAFAPPTP